MQNVGQRLRALREQRSLSARAVAEAIGVTTQNVTAWERGEYQPKTREVVLALDDFLGADGELLAAYGYRTEDGALSERVAELESQMNEVLRRLQALTQRLPGR